MKHRLVNVTNFRLEEGNCWITALPADIQSGAHEGTLSPSGLRLFENGVELGPGSASHATIRKTGGGAFSHWGADLYFSSSDNSSPKSNRRTYVALVPEASVQDADGHVSTSFNAAEPVNYSNESYSSRNIASDAEYAVKITESYVSSLPDGLNSLVGKSVLELGPGISFGTVLAMRALGARSVAIADRFLAQFSVDYHPQLYREIAVQLEKNFPNVDTSFLEQAAVEGHTKELVEAYEIPLERLGQHFHEIDIILSNAVLEHLFDPMAGAIALHAITAPDGIGLHQVDFRDHRDFSKPLEYLLLDDEEFTNLFNSCHGECGRKTRPFQMARMFELAGFEGVDFLPNMHADPEYLADIIARLRAQPANLYGYIDTTMLAPISGQFRLRKPV
ncbi:methyltransferase domain-containing protein [Roseibium sediminis]|uniref:methyltransferase domain-containing protein n=1 Tax=Roseibium sediminis TaxID=1775174 RepID=UPI00123D27EC|nr:methyltransferase domain-containing protein [Roseibium sediminis]